MLHWKWKRASRVAFRLSIVALPANALNSHTDTRLGGSKAVTGCVRRLRRKNNDVNDYDYDYDYDYDDYDYDYDYDDDDDDDNDDDDDDDDDGGSALRARSTALNVSYGAL